MLTIDNKFNIGDECYTYYRRPIHYKCPICEGAGEFEYKGHKIWCKNCSGSGKLHNANQCVAEPCKVRVKSIKIGYHSQGYNVKYAMEVLDPIIANIRNRQQSTVFSDLESCQEHCDKINLREVPAEF